MNQEELLILFSKRVKSRMNILHINQRILSERTGIPKQSISRYLQRERKPTFDVVVRIAQALECKPGDLIDIDEPLELN